MKHLNKKFSTMTIFLPATIMALLLMSSLAFAQDGARVYLQPVGAAEGTLTVEVIAENVTDMYGAEFRLKYDPAMISVQDSQADREGIQVEPGSLLPPDQGFIVANEVNEAEGTVVFALTLLNPAPPVSGSGPLARITFNILQTGPATIDIERAKLVAVDLQTIPSQTEAFIISHDGQLVAAGSEGQAATTNDQDQAATANNDQAVVVAPAPAVVETPPAVTDSNFPWWIVAASVMVLGILALGGFIMMGGLSPPATPPATQQATRPGQQSSGTESPRRRRPSAFKN